MGTKVAIAVAEYERTAFDGPDCEYLDGEIVERSLPDYFHAKTQGRFTTYFNNTRANAKLPLFPASELRNRVRPDRYMIPDVCVFWRDEPQQRVPEFRPLIVIEVLSPEDSMSAVRGKLQEYTDWGVPHIWLVDPHRRLFYTCRDGLHEVSSFLVPEAGLEIHPADIFEN